MSIPSPRDSIPSTPPSSDKEPIGATGGDNGPVQPPTPVKTSPRDSLTPSAAAPLVPETEKYLEGNVYDLPERRKSLFRRPVFWLAAAAALVFVILAVILPVYFTVIKPKNNGNTNGGTGTNNGNSSDNPKPNNAITTGGDGSKVTTDNGTEFTYRNPFGGFWVWDSTDPFNNNAQASSWTPPLNTTWKWGIHKLYGVNLGGWFVLEPFISPQLFQRYVAAGAVDEWTISTLMANDTANGGLSQLEHHYDTFITEQDFAEIAGAGLNWVRIPVPWWAIDVWDGEPFMPRTSWKYILRAFQWARKYGLRVAIDLHVAPGSQNAFNHSGKQATFNFLNGPMGFANAQRMLNYIRIFIEFVSQPEYVDVIPMFGIVNEALSGMIGVPTLTSFNLEVHRMAREITGIGEGKGPYLAITDGIGGLYPWAGLLPNADRLALDTHTYFAFGGQPNTEPVNVPAVDGKMGGVWPERACQQWKNTLTTIQTDFGVTFAGEYSNGFNDCGFYLRSVEPYTPANPNCPFWNDWENWDQATKDGLHNIALASMDALVNPFFWTWKVGPTLAGKVEAPLWSYKLGLDNGWMPKDPRQSDGKCAALKVTPVKPFNGEYFPWQTGGAGAGQIPASVTSSYPWPPATISNAQAPPSLMPQYTSTGPINTLPAPTNTGTKTKVDGWYNDGDTTPGPTPIAGCKYPNPWAVGYDLPLPIAGCSAGTP